MNLHALREAVQSAITSPATSRFPALATAVHPHDLAEAMSHFAVEDVARILLQIHPPVRAALFVHFSPAHQDAVLQASSREAQLALLRHMPADDRADLFNRMDPPLRHALLAALRHHERDDVLKLTAFPEGTVGSVTTSDFVAVDASIHVDSALRHLRSIAPTSEALYVLYVLDDGGRLRGTLSLRDLVLAAPDVPLSALLHADPVFVRASWPRQQAAELIRRYDLLAVPVIDGNDRMIGIVTVDDAMDIDKEQDANQLARFGGTAVGGGTDLDIVRTPLRRMFNVRVFWLAVLTGFGVLTSTFVVAQEEILSQVIVLAAFIAPIVDMGGNTGSQSATLVIRSMALGELTGTWRHILFVIRREVPVAFGLGITIALLEAVLAYFSKGIGGDILLVVGLSMLVCTVLGGIIGALLPFAARRIGADPATLSSPLITSIMDLLGVVIYFGFAWLLLGDQLRGVVA